MGKKFGNGILILILTVGVLTGAYLSLLRYQAERESRTVELVVDLNDLKKMAAFEKKPLGPILDGIRALGISGVGVFEETLPDAAAAGEIFYAKGSGILRFKNLNPMLSDLTRSGRIKPSLTYLYIPEDNVRKRIYNQLKFALGKNALKFLNRSTIQVNEIEEELRPLGLGISESQDKYLQDKGFRVVPRVWNDPRYHLGNIEDKISGLKGHDLIIFDGEEILGYPEAIPALASALKKFGIRYGYVEIVKQAGDTALRKRMGRDLVRVHSVPKDELKKIHKEEALDRFVRAVRERSIRLIYLRPFLPPQIDAFPVEYNLGYLGELKTRLEGAGYTLGRAEEPSKLRVQGWQIMLLGLGVVIGGLLLLNCFVALPVWLMYLLLFLAAGLMYLAGALGHRLLLQKFLALSAALVFPSYAVISTFSHPREGPDPSFREAVLLIVNITMETIIGIFLMLGLLADYRFMSGIETFPAVKIALTLPLLIVGACLLWKSEQGKLRAMITKYLNMKVSLLTVGGGIILLGAFAVLVARSGNFVLPVPAFEKYFRNWLEMLLFIRPRTKEFLVGYPFIFAAAFFYIKGKRGWLWLLAAIGAVAPVSVFNSFSHIHTPLQVSAVRSFNGLVLGVLIGCIAWFFIKRFYKKKERSA
jgi:hypothetical protein